MTEDKKVEEIKKKHQDNLIENSVIFAKMHELSEITFKQYNRGYEVNVQVSYIGDDGDDEE